MFFAMALWQNRTTPVTRRRVTRMSYSEILKIITEPCDSGNPGVRIKVRMENSGAPGSRTKPYETLDFFGLFVRSFTHIWYGYRASACGTDRRTRPDRPGHCQPGTDVVRPLDQNSTGA